MFHLLVTALVAHESVRLAMFLLVRPHTLIRLVSEWAFSENMLFYEINFHKHMLKLQNADLLLNDRMLLFLI